MTKKREIHAIGCKEFQRGKVERVGLYCFIQMLPYFYKETRFLVRVTTITSWGVECRDCRRDASTLNEVVEYLKNKAGTESDVTVYINLGWEKDLRLELEQKFEGDPLFFDTQCKIGIMPS